MADKQVFIKLYASDGTYKGVFFDFSFTSFTTQLNAGLGDLTVTLNRKFDDTSFITPGDELRIFIADGESPTGTRIFSGEVDDILSTVDSEENVSVNCSGYTVELALGLYREGTVVRKEFDSQDLSDHIKDILDQYQTNNSTAKITYTGSSIESAGKSRVLNLYANTYLEGIKQAVSKADEGYYFFVDANNVFNFKQVSSTADHFFILGKDIARLIVSENTRQTRSDYLFYNGQVEDDPGLLFKAYNEASAPVEDRWERVRDARFSDEDSVDDKAARYFSIYGQAVSSVKARIVDSNIAGGFDIESVQVGDTCRFLNTESTANVAGLKIITQITYSINYIDIVTEDIEAFVNRQISQNQQQINFYAYETNSPSQYQT
jgi:hypothetical protein